MSVELPRALDRRGKHPPAMDDRALSLEPSRLGSDVVVGLGNDIARDDGVGIAVARSLERRLSGRPGIEVVALPWAGLALLDALAGRRRAVIVDCSASGERPPGTVVRLDEHDFRGSVRLVSCHDLDFATVLALGRRMGWPMPTEIAVWAIEGGALDTFGEGLSAPVAAAAARVEDEVLAYLGAAQPGEPRPQGAAS